MTNSEILWNPPPSNLTLSNNEVHVWCVNLNLPASRVEQLAQNLSPDEQGRADRFYFGRHKRRFIVARGFLRIILGNYLDMEPDNLVFSYSERGKPELAFNSREGMLCFNVSHSHELGLYAITRDHHIGIDIEHFRSNLDLEQLAKRYFSPREYAVISSLHPDQKQEVFYNCWTQKEAYLKATGEGLAGLEGVEVSLDPGKPAALLSIKGNTQSACCWSVHQLRIPKPGYAAALVVEKHSFHINYFYNFETLWRIPLKKIV